MAATLRTPETEAVPAAPSGGDRQLGVERSVFRYAIAGSLIGAVVCAGIWSVLMAVALAGDRTNFGPMLLVGAGCGVFAGIFLGGWAGTLAGAARLEHHEHEILPHR